MAAALATLLATNILHKDFQVASGQLCNFVAANKSKNQTRIISGVGSGGQGGAGRGHSGGRSSGRVVAGAVDADKEAGTISTSKRSCHPGVIQQRNGDSSCMSRKNL